MGYYKKKIKENRHPMYYQRKKCGFTQTELGQICGMKKQYICNIETFRVRPGIKTIEKLCIALCCDVALFFQDQEGYERAVTSRTKKYVDVKWAREKHFKKQTILNKAHDMLTDIELLDADINIMS